MKLLIPFDFSPVSKNAIQQALNLSIPDGAEIFILHFVQEKEQIQEKELHLRTFVKGLILPKNVLISAHVVVGDFLNDIGKIAGYHGVDLVVMGTHGVDFLQKMFGSNSVKIIRNSTVPFIVMQEECEISKINKIVMPYSIERKSMQVLRIITQLSKINQAEIHLLGRVHEDEFEKHQENTGIIMAKKHLIENNVKHEFVLKNLSKSEFETCIIDYSKEIKADLIALTYYSDSLLPIFEKFVQNIIVNSAHIPVLCVNAQSLSKADSILSFMTS
ncbi:MAG: universal stress protein [Flavobacteriia bacterium]|nr:universal stress protein [Flavobacteriia bacterium]